MMGKSTFHGWRMTSTLTASPSKLDDNWSFLLLYHILGMMQSFFLTKSGLSWLLDLNAGFTIGQFRLIKGKLRQIFLFRGIFFCPYYQASKSRLLLEETLRTSTLMAGTHDVFEIDCLKSCYLMLSLSPWARHCWTSSLVLFVHIRKTMKTDDLYQLTIKVPVYGWTVV